MSTLPFLLSVADELDNVNSQSYMDDFGLGFHPHRQYYRTPSIQLSLPASTDWMQERQRCRTHKFVDESQNNLRDADEDDADDYDYDAEADNRQRGALDADGPSTSAAGGRQREFGAALNSNPNPHTSRSRGRNANASPPNADDNSVQMYKLSKKCCKNYHQRRGGGASDSGVAPERTASADGSYRLHAKCMESSHSSSEESLQKAPASSIEFLTCFLVKKSRAPKHAGGEGGAKKSS